MVRHTLKILLQILRYFQSVSDLFGTFCIKGLKSVSSNSCGHQFNFILEINIKVKFSFKVIALMKM